MRIVYVNDTHIASTKLNYILFADNTNVLLSKQNLDNLVAELNTELPNLFNWFITKFQIFISDINKRNTTQNINNFKITITKEIWTK